MTEDLCENSKKAEGKAILKLDCALQTLCIYAVYDTDKGILCSEECEGIFLTKLESGRFPYQVTPIIKYC